MERLDAMAVFARVVEAEGFSRAGLRAGLSTRHLSPKVRVFVDFLAERFGGAPYWDEGLSAG